MPVRVSNQTHERSVNSRSAAVQATLDRESKKLQSGVKEGIKEVSKGYTGWDGTKNVTSKGAGVIVGAVSSKGASTVAREAAKTASASLGRHAAIEAGEKAAAKVMLKGASKGLGVIGFIPEAMDFAKGFARGYSAAGN